MRNDHLTAEKAEFAEKRGRCVSAISADSAAKRPGLT
jgi:hypothetical protein